MQDRHPLRHWIDLVERVDQDTREPIQLNSPAVNRRMRAIKLQSPEANRRARAIKLQSPETKRKQNAIRLPAPTGR